VNTLEDRLRDAYRAAAETVGPEEILSGAILSPPDRARRRARRTGQTGPGPSRRRVLIPLAAAVAVIAVAAVVAVLLPRAAPGLGRGNPTTSQTAPALLTTPAYFVELNWTDLNFTPHPSMYVVNATTGAQGARISLPFPAADLTSVATGDGQTFVVAATAPEGCSTTLYRFTLAANGTPSTMTAFTKVTGQISDPWEMAVSAGGQFVAYQTLACGQQDNSVAGQQSEKGYLSVLDTATGRIKQWTYRTPANGFMPGTGNVSISTNGNVVGFSNEVIDTSAPAGSLAAHARVVATNGEFGPSTIPGGLDVSPDGTTAYFATFKTANNKPVWTGHQLRAFDLATGQTRLVGSFPGTEGSPAAVTFDPTGRYMIVESVVNTGPATKPLPTTKLALVDTATGQVTQLNASWAADPEIAW
jgi:hypothetical protein